MFEEKLEHFAVFLNIIVELKARVIVSDEGSIFEGEKLNSKASQLLFSIFLSLLSAKIFKETLLVLSVKPFIQRYRLVQKNLEDP